LTGILAETISHANYDSQILVHTEFTSLQDDLVCYASFHLYGRERERERERNSETAKYFAPFPSSLGTGQLPASAQISGFFFFFTCPMKREWEI
jgi:hypothetical protein